MSQFISQRNRHHALADADTVKCSQLIHHLSGFFHLTQIAQLVNTVQRIVEKMRIDLKVQGLEFRLLFGEHFKLQVFHQQLDPADHVVDSFADLIDFLAAPCGYRCI